MPLFLFYRCKNLFIHRIFELLLENLNPFLLEVGLILKRETYAPGKNILKVPTFVFKREGVEIGRIIESPTENLGDDIIKILVN